MRAERILLLLTLFLLNVRALSAVPVPAYDVRGVAIHQCSCKYACPCMFEDAPNMCALAAVYHVDQGDVGGVDVSGLSFISVDGTPAAGHENPQGGVVYLDRRADPAQRRALLLILKDHGEWPWDGRPIENVPILFMRTATGYNTVVPGRFRGEVAQVKSRSGTSLTVDGVGFAEGARWVVGRSLINRLHDVQGGVSWDLAADTNGSWTLLHWTHS